MSDPEDFTEQERIKILARIGALSATIEKASAELRLYVDALRDKKPKKQKDVDENGDPMWRFKVKTPIPSDIRLTRRLKQYALDKGFTATSVQPVWDEFVNYYQRSGTKWVDWCAVWQKWVRTELERRATKSSGSSRDLQEL